MFSFPRECRPPCTRPADPSPASFWLARSVLLRWLAGAAGGSATPPPQAAPHQPRLDWPKWFAATDNPQEYPRTLHLVWKLLHNGPGALSLLAANPFPGHPPRCVCAVLYGYRFAAPGNPERAWWTRTKLGLWLPPLPADDPGLIAFLRQAGWLPAADDPAPAGR